MRVSSAPITGPCYYGIDTPHREELIAANMTIEEIAAHIGVDTLGYLSLDGMLESVPDGPGGVCHACFSGDYPTPPPTDPDKLRFGCGCCTHRTRRAPASLPTPVAMLVYFFGNGKAEGTREMREVLGGKGANLAEMTNLGVPVPPGFTIACSVC